VYYCPLRVLCACAAESALIAIVLYLCTSIIMHIFISTITLLLLHITIIYFYYIKIYTIYTRHSTLPEKEAANMWYGSRRAGVVPWALLPYWGVAVVVCGGVRETPKAHSEPETVNCEPRLF